MGFDTLCRKIKCWPFGHFSPYRTELYILCHLFRVAGILWNAVLGDWQKSYTYLILYSTVKHLKGNFHFFSAVLHLESSRSTATSPFGILCSAVAPTSSHFPASAPASRHYSAGASAGRHCSADASANSHCSAGASASRHCSAGAPSSRHCSAGASASRLCSADVSASRLCSAGASASCHCSAGASASSHCSPCASASRHCSLALPQTIGRSSGLLTVSCPSSPATSHQEKDKRTTLLQTFRFIQKSKWLLQQKIWFSITI